MCDWEEEGQVGQIAVLPAPFSVIVMLKRGQAGAGQVLP